ncbi:hypothetical protein V3C99_015247 [Haemonchus contortus]|uniref:7TM_GPCR_Srx domain-containing protein n=1 Tax=Haemonchus contortus TaxID=6289 RepID=A0A7I4YVI2_HAECO|nr:7TM GPCR domain containing protein [Haemonchus contortus]
MLLPDAVAGLFLVLIGLVGVLLYGLITYSMLQMIGEIVGFRFLISQAITDLLLLLQFAIWPGFTILIQDEVLPEGTRWHVHIYLDFTWWAMVYHYTVVAWSRWAAVQWPNWFRVLAPTTCLAICAAPWVAGLVQSIVEHQFDWFVPLYFNPSRYGMDADWVKYNESGTNTYYMVCNVVLMVLPFPFYAAALIILFRRQAERTIKARVHTTRSTTPALLSIQRQMSIETRLLVPCIINTILFVVGQVFISQCSKHGKWMNWAVMVVFAANSLVNPLLYLFFSSVIRKGVISAFRDNLALSAIYDYELRSSSGCGSSEQRHSLIRLNRDSTVTSQLNRVCSSR